LHFFGVFEVFGDFLRIPSRLTHNPLIQHSFSLSSNARPENRKPLQYQHVTQNSLLGTTKAHTCLHFKHLRYTLQILLQEFQLFPLWRQSNSCKLHLE